MAPRDQYDDAQEAHAQAPLPGAVVPESQDLDLDLGALLVRRMLDSPSARRKAAGFDWAGGPASGARGTGKPGTTTTSSGSGSPLQQEKGVEEESKAPEENHDEEEDEEDGDIEWWESPAFVSVLQECLAWPLGVLYSFIVVFICTWAHLWSVLCYRLGRLARRLVVLWRRAFPTSAPAPPCSLSRPDLAREASIQVVKSGLYFYGLGNVAAPDSDSCPFFDPRKPTVIYVHGYQPRTIIRRFRESFNWSENDAEYGLDVNAADHWIKGGFNVGIFFWQAYADEAHIVNAEAKIWTNQTSVGMRYRKLAQCGTRVQMRYVFLPHIPCVSQQLCDTLQRRFPAGAANYRLVGHSLGSQVVIHATTLLAQAKQQELQARQPAAAATASGDSGAPGQPAAIAASFILPTRIALLDPFFTLTPKRYLGWRTLPAVLTEEMALLARDEGVVFETYQTSILSHAASRYLKPFSAFFELDLPHIPWWRLRSRHVCAPYIYFMSFAAPEALGRLVFSEEKLEASLAHFAELSHDALEARDALAGALIGARLPDEHLRTLMHASLVDDLHRLFFSYRTLLATS